MRQDKVEGTTSGIDEQLNTPLQVQSCLQNIQSNNKILYEILQNSFNINCIKYKKLRWQITEMEQTELTNARKNLSDE